MALTLHPRRSTALSLTPQEASMRLFIGLNLPNKQRARIHQASRALRTKDLPVRWLEPDAFHVTLKFLGEVRPDQVDAIEERLLRVASTTKSFVTELSGFGAFPTIRRPEVLWLGVGANAELRCLKQDLEWALGEIGFEAETRAFHPHVTLGRTTGVAGAGAFRGFDVLMADLDFEGTLKVRAVDLMRSRPSRERGRYSVLSSAKLSSR